MTDINRSPQYKLNPQHPEAVGGCMGTAKILTIEEKLNKKTASFIKTTEKLAAYLIRDIEGHAGGNHNHRREPA